MDRTTLIIAVIATLIAGVATWWQTPKPPDTTPTPPIRQSRIVAPNQDPSHSVDMIWVQVSGAVHHPQSLQLPKGSRVKDAIAVAGGTLRSADTRNINWVGKLRDGQHVRVPVANPPRTQRAKPKSQRLSNPTHVDINAASATELVQQFGLTREQARAVIQHRNTLGPIRDEWDLNRVILSIEKNK